jgi:hypothetical protein
MKFPDITHMLPSQARSALEEYFFQSLVESGLDYLGEPKYEIYDDREVEAIRDTQGSYAYSVAVKAYDAAQKRYDAEHPRVWDNEKQKFFVPSRAGLKTD